MNNYAKALSITGWIVLVAGIIGSFVLDDQLRDDRCFFVAPFSLRPELQNEMQPLSFRTESVVG